MLLAQAADRQQAAVLHVSTPKQLLTLTHGRKYPGGPPTEPDDLFVLASVSKPYLAAAILRLQERRALTLDGPVTTYLKPRTTKGFRSLKRVSLRHLLAMRSGLPDYYTDRYFDQLIVRRRMPVTLETALNFGRGKRPLFQPGAEFDYSNTNFLLAQAALEQVAGAPMHAVFNDLLFRPAGLRQTWIINAPGSRKMTVAGFENLFGKGRVDVTPYYHAPGFGDGGLVASAQDVGRFFRALLIDKSLLSPASLRQMTQDPEGDRYGLGIDVERRKGQGLIYGHAGGDMGFASNVRISAKNGIVVVALFASDRADDRLADRVLLELLDTEARDQKHD